jgi:hypothetical protein
MACTPQRSHTIGELAGGRLTAGAVEELLDHVESCRPCSRELDDVAALLAAAPALRASARPAFWPRALGLLGAAAALVLALLLANSGDGRRARELTALADPTPLPALPGVLRGDPADERARPALADYAAGRWPEAARGLAAARAAGDQRPLVALYLGLARLQFAPDEALEPLASAAQAGEGLLAERALWYLAQAHLLRRDEDAARAALTRLVQRSGDYELNARELLERLDER